jgi:AraC-like DNA-binding protein
MTTTVARDRLRALIDVLLSSLDEHAAGEELAQRAFLSRFHFDRLVAAGLGEPPGGLRRRLLLERAAYELSARKAPVAEAAVGAGYASAEAFARSFRRAYGAAPSRFAGDFRLPAPNGIHFHPPGGLVVPAGTERCDPPQTFTFGGMVAHVLTWSAYRRQAIVGVLRDLGAEGLGIGDPLEWERRAGLRASARLPLAARRRGDVAASEYGGTCRFRRAATTSPRPFGAHPSASTARARPS